MSDQNPWSAAYAFLLMFTAPFIFGIALVHTAPAYILSRFLIGWALAAFVTCQFWTSIMFSPNVVGFANALAGGWGNAGKACLLLFFSQQIPLPDINMLQVYTLPKHKIRRIIRFFLPTSVKGLK